MTNVFDTFVFKTEWTYIGRDEFGNKFIKCKCEWEKSNFSYVLDNLFYQSLITRRRIFTDLLISFFKRC